jgi:hypothetical protein
MEKKITISYWWKCNSFRKEIPSQLEEVLAERAERHIFEKAAEGYYSEGELYEGVDIDIPGEKTPKDGFECEGWFIVKRE